MRSLEVKVKKKFKEFELDIDFKTTGRRLGILGASGSGKSMTLKMIAGIEKPDEGVVVYTNTDDSTVSLTEKPGAEIVEVPFFDSSKRINLKPAQRDLGYMFQNYALFPNMSVEKNIEAGIRNRTRTQKAEIVAHMIKKFRLQGLEKRLPSQLSGGQQQRVALARMLAYEPQLLLFDEPFSALDYHLKDVMAEELLMILEEFDGLVIMVSHSRDEIYKFCDEMIVLDEGHLSAHGKTTDVFRKPENAVTAKLIGCKNISRAIRLDDHHVKLPEWNVTIETGYVLNEELNYVGYKAHFFEPVWDDDNYNAIPFDLKTVAHLPFDTQYYVNAGAGQICYFVPNTKNHKIEERGLPKYLRFREEDILQLK